MGRCKWDQQPEGHLPTSLCPQGTWKSSESSVLYWLDSVSECSAHHCNSLKQLAESKSLASSWDKSISGKSE